MTARWLIALPLTCCLPLAASAADYDGSKALRCAGTDLVSCDGAGQCERTTAAILDLPGFVTIDFDKKLIFGKLDNGEARKTPIERMEADEFGTMIQGGEYGKAWSIVIQPDTGHFSAAIAGENGAIAILGVCEPD